MLNKEILSLLEQEHLRDAALLPLSACHITLPRLLGDEGLEGGSVIVFLIPYYTEKPENFSAYAAARDYHLYIRELEERLAPAFGALYPGYRFQCFADHAPIDERHAAVTAGLGVYGKNGLLLTEKYSSYQFIGEWITNAPPELLGQPEIFSLRTCPGCGACLAACPTGILRGEGKECLSAITQKKGELCEAEAALLRKCNTAWGCDICQEACPYTRRATRSGSIQTPIPFFREECIYRLDGETLSSLTGDRFRARAFAWRGKKTVERNVRILTGANGPAVSRSGAPAVCAPNIPAPPAERKK